MRPYAVRHLTLTICAAALIPLFTATDGEASSRHVRKHQSISHQRISHQRMSPGFRRVWAVGEIRPVAPTYNRVNVCPGLARSFECSVWPPPFEDDPDRKVSGNDGGG
jgi:hypothetical protein